MKNNYIFKDDLCYIDLKRKDGTVLKTIIDIEDFELVNSQLNSWSIRNNYVSSHFLKNRTLYLHRLIMNLENSKLQIDHINHDTLDNRKSNLRIVTIQENQFNQKQTKGYYKYRGLYRSQITINNKTIQLGIFKTEQEAIQAYVFAKSQYHTIGGEANV